MNELCEIGINIKTYRDPLNGMSNNTNTRALVLDIIYLCGAIFHPGLQVELPAQLHSCQHFA